MNAEEARKISDLSRKGSRLSKILRDILDESEKGNYHHCDYLNEVDIESLTKLGYSINIHTATRLPFGQGDPLCDIFWSN